MQREKEEDLIKEALKGENDAFEALLHPYRQGILNMAYHLTGDLEEAKEVCQNAYIKIFKYLGSFKPERSFKNWLYKTVINCSYDSLNKRKRAGQMIESHKDLIMHQEYDPEENYLRKEIRSKLKKCLKVLSPKEMAVFLLRDKEGYSVNETAEILKSSSISVRANLSRARQKLRIQFEKVYPEKIREVKR